MRTVLFTSTFILFFYVLGFSQTKDTNLKEETNTYKDTSSEMTETQFYNSLNQQFTYIISGQSKSSIGNFASLDVNNAEAILSGSIKINGSSIFGIKAIGTESDGVMALFNNTKINTKVSLDLQFNTLINLFFKPYIIFDDAKWKRYNDNYKLIMNKYQNINNSISNRYRRDTASLKQKDVALKFLIDSLTAESLSESNYFRKESIVEKIDNLEAQRDSINYLKDNFPRFSTKRLEILQKRSEELRNNDLDLDISSFKLGWLSFGYKIQDNRFNYFNSLLSFEDQVSKNEFICHEVRIQYSVYNWNNASFESYFWSLGSAFSYTDNFSDLSSIDISEEKNYGPNPNDRISTGKFTAYQGEYKKHLKNLKFYGNVFWFLFNDNNFALHFFPEINSTFSEKKPVWNAGTGLLFCFKKSDDKSSIINAEIFCNFLDLFYAKDIKYKPLQRYDLGIVFSLPIHFKSL